LTKSQLIAEVTRVTKLKKGEVTRVVDAALGVISRRLAKHEKVQLTGFGSFEPRRRKPRNGVNPRTRQKIEVDATWSLLFRPSKRLREMVTGKKRR